MSDARKPRSRNVTTEAGCPEPRVFLLPFPTESLRKKHSGDAQPLPLARLVSVPYLDDELPLDSPSREFEPVHFRKLRIALAMRGGVSLAVWIGGAVAEIDLWRRLRVRTTADGSIVALYIPASSNAPRLDETVHRRVLQYAMLLHATGYDTVELDVLAGASAGGLNAVMYAVAQRAGSDVNGLLPTWVQVGGAWTLMQRPGARRVDSVLRGDGYFWPQVKAALSDFYDTDVHPQHRTKRITVDLSATVADGEDASERGTKEGRGHFHFVGSDQQSEIREHGRAIPAPDSRTLDRDIARLALAARSTSSFPGAFEPALIFSKKTTWDSPEAVGGDENRVDMSFAFHAHREDWSHPFRVVDGGVLDNIPIDRAFRAIRTMASETNVTRALIYLDPNPPIQPIRSIRPLRYGSPKCPPPDGPRSLLMERFKDRQSHFLAGIAAGRGKRGISESGGDEEDEVEQFRLNLLLDSGRDESLTPFSRAAMASYDRQLATDAYIRYRSTADPQFFSVILASPSVWQLSTNLRTREVWTAWGADERTGLPERFIDGYDVISHNLCAPWIKTALTDGQQALIDAARSALSWIRALEDLPGDLTMTDADPGKAQSTSRLTSIATPPRQLGELRSRLYGVFSAAIDARDRCIRDCLRTVQAARDARASGEPLPGEGPLADQVPDPGNSPLPQGSAGLVQSLYRAWLVSSNVCLPELVAQWDELEACIFTLRALSTAMKENADWHEQPWSYIPSLRQDFGAKDLAPFAAAMGIPEPIPRLTFWKLTADEPPAKPEEFATLHRRKFRQAATTAVSLDKHDLDSDVAAQLFRDHSLHSDDKLAGTSLFNFAGFLSKGWRANDWWWGRLDGAAGMVRFVSALIPPIETADATPVGDCLDGRRDENGPIDPEPIVELVQAAVLSESAAASPGAKPFHAPITAAAAPQEIRERFTLGADTLGDLRPAYLVSVLSRGIRVASRAFSGSIGMVPRLLLVLLRPLLVFVPIVLNPLREALIAATLGLAIALSAGGLGLVSTETHPGGSGFYPVVIGGVLIGLVVAALIITVTLALRGWRRVRKLLDELDPQPPQSTLDNLTEFHGSAKRQGFTYAAFAVASLVVAGGVLWYIGMSVPFWILTVSAFILVLRARIRFRSPNESPHRVALYLFGVVAYLVWMALVVLLPWFQEQMGADTEFALPFVVGGGGFLVATIVTVRWLPVWGNLRTVLINWFTISLVAGGAAGATALGLLQFPGTELPLVNAVAAVVIVTVIWGSLVWWLPEIREGTKSYWKIKDIDAELRG